MRAWDAAVGTGGRERRAPRRLASGVASALLVGGWSVGLLLSEAARADVVLKALPDQSHVGMIVGRFPADSTLKSPVWKLKPEETWPISAVEAHVSADTGLCADQPIEAILEMPNKAAAKAPDQASECLFAVALTIKLADRTYEAGGECGDWHDNAAQCWGYGETGEFRIQREGPKAQRLTLVFPGAAESGAAAAAKEPAEGEVVAQKHGMFLDTIFDDKSQPKSDVWLVWPDKTVKLTFGR